MTTPRHQLGLLAARLDAAIVNALFRSRVRYLEAAGRLRSAAEHARVVDGDGAILIRRLHPAPLTVGDVTLISPNKATHGLRETTLAQSEYDVLRLLMTNPGRVLPHDRIVNDVWGAGRVSESELRQIVHRLRVKIGDDPRLIHTEHGLGYAFRPPGWTDPPHGSITVGKLVLDPSTQKATYDGRLLNLRPSRFAILEGLMLRSGQIVSPSELSQIVARRGHVLDSGSIRRPIADLRRELGDPEIIENFYGRGYRLREP